MRDPEDRYFYTTTLALIAALQEVVEHKPNARLMKNGVGNLSIVDPETRTWVGYIDLHEAATYWNEPGVEWKVS